MGRAAVAVVKADQLFGVSVPGSYGRSALAAAAQAEEVDVLRLLSAEGADVDTENKQGATPLMVAVKDEKAKVVVSQQATERLLYRCRPEHYSLSDSHTHLPLGRTPCVTAPPTYS